MYQEVAAQLIHQSQYCSRRMLDQTRLITAVSELARNIVVHAGSGTMAVYPPRSEERRGMRIVFQDRGPGIPGIRKPLSRRELLRRVRQTLDREKEEGA